MRFPTDWPRPARGRILIAPQETHGADLIAAQLRRDGHQVEICHGGEDALRFSDTEVALIDLAVPGTSAVGLMEDLRERVAGPFEALIMVEEPTPDLQADILSRGAFMVLEKPVVHLSLISALVQRALDKVRAEQERDRLAVQLSQVSDTLGHELSIQTTEDLEAGDSLADLSKVDPQTGLPNRRASEERYLEEVARALRYSRGLCLALCNIQGLSAAQAGLGAETVSQSLANLFQSMVRDVDFIGRNGEEEFLFLLPETDKVGATKVMERIRQKIGQTAFSDASGAAPKSYPLQASIGIAGLPADTMNGDILKEAAELALKRARSLGDQVVPYNPSTCR